MAATSTIGGFDFISICPRTHTLRNQIQSVSRVTNRFSAYSTRVGDVRCKTTSRNVEVFSIRSMGSVSTGPQPEDSVKKAIAENPVVVYSKTWCSYPVEVKSLFKILSVEPFVVELDQLGMAV